MTKLNRTQKGFKIKYKGERNAFSNAVYYLVCMYCRRYGRLFLCTRQILVKTDILIYSSYAIYGSKFYSFKISVLPIQGPRARHMARLFNLCIYLVKKCCLPPFASIIPSSRVGAGYCAVYLGYGSDFLHLRTHFRLQFLRYKIKGVFVKLYIQVL